MKRQAEATQVSSCRLPAELHPAEASVPTEASRPEAWDPLKALDHLVASHLEEPRRLSSFHLPEAYLQEASAHPAGSHPAALAHREFDRGRARRREGYRARARRRLQQASYLLGTWDQIFLASLYDVRLNGLEKDRFRTKLFRLTRGFFTNALTQVVLTSFFSAIRKRRDYTDR